MKEGNKTPSPVPILRGSDDIIKAICDAVVLGDDEKGNPVHLSASEARKAIAAYQNALATPHTHMEMVAIPKSMIMWLLGAGPDVNGEWFEKPEGAPAFWWRTHFKKLWADFDKGTPAAQCAGDGKLHDWDRNGRCQSCGCHYVGLVRPYPCPAPRAMGIEQDKETS